MSSFIRFDEISTFINSSYTNTKLPEHFYKNWVEYYLNIAFKDLLITSDELFLKSRLNDRSVISSSDLKIKISSNLKFGAMCYFENKENVKFSLSLGTLLSLDDLCMRACCNMDFFSRDNNFMRLWNGSRCLWLKGRMSPYIRYHDYNISNYDIYSHIVKNNPILPPISAFFSGLPIDSEQPKFNRERSVLSDLMTNIALLWIIMHEEAHYWKGHAHYLLARQESKGLRFPTLCKIDEVDGNKIIDNNNLRKVFEWEADKSATQNTLQILSKWGLDKYLPSYCKNKKEWMFRLILTSIGLAILTMHKAHTIHGTSSYYPIPRTRLVSVITASSRYLGYKDWPKDIVTDMDRVNAYIGMLFDLQIASELLKNDNDTIGTDIKDKDIELFDDQAAEIFEIVTHLVTGDPPKLEFINSKWINEIKEVSALQEKVYIELAPYRLLAGNTWE